MKHTEYKEKLDAIFKNPDTGLAEISGVYDELEKDLTARDTALAKVEELEKTVDELRETNLKLYLSQSGEPTEKDEPTDEEKEETETAEAVDDFFGDLLGIEKEEKE